MAYFITEFTYPYKEEELPMKTWIVQTDGSAMKKVGGARVVLISLEREILKYAVRLQFSTTNNEAEYEALLTGLSLGKALGAKNLIVQADSWLIIRQVKEDYEAREESMQKYLKIVQQLSQHFDSLDFVQIPWAKNVEADFLARLASSDHYNAPFELCIEIRGNKVQKLSKF